MSKTLGEFEQSILFALLELEDDEAYGVSIRETIQRRIGRSVSTGAVYTTLDRLREHGLVASWTSEPTGERGGRRKRLYRLTPEGADTLARARDTGAARAILRLPVGDETTVLAALDAYAAVIEQAA